MFEIRKLSMCFRLGGSFVLEIRRLSKCLRL